MIDAEHTSRAQQTAVVVIGVAIAIILTMGFLGMATGDGETAGSDVTGSDGATAQEGTLTVTPEPATPTPEPATPTPEPATPTPDPATPTPDPATPTPEPAPETTLHLAPGSDHVRPGKTETYEVVVGSAHDGIGGAEMVLAVEAPSIATITEVTVLGSGGEVIDIAEDGSRADISYTDRDTYDSGSFPIIEVTVEGQSHGETSLSLGAANGSDEVLLFDEEGTGYDVTDTIGATVTVESGGGGTPEPTPESAPGEKEFTRDEIAQAKYGLDFEELSTETAGEVQAVFNRQPFPEGTTPADIRTRDEITQDRYERDFEDVSRETTIEIQNDYDAQFTDDETE